MSVFLIDYENVNVDGMMGLDQVGENDRIILFFSVNSNTMTFALHQSLSETSAKVEYIEVKSGTKNSLDFQLVSYLGFLIAKDGSSDYVIVSKDNGFASTVNFWRNRKIDISLAYNLMKESRASVEKDLRKALPDLESEIPKIVKLLEKYKTKQGINNALVKELGSDKGSVVYKSIRPLLSNIKTK